MAGDWIAMRLDLYEDPAVAFMAERLGEREEVIVGFLHRVWSWASRQCHDGRVFISVASLGRVTSLPDFPQLMVEAGWLEHGTDGNGKPFVQFPNWERWMGESAKKRLYAARRKQKERVTQMSQKVVTEKTKKQLIPERLRAEVYERDGHKCVYCGWTKDVNAPAGPWVGAKLSLHHVIPESRGGATNLENLVACCTVCNQKLGNKMPGELCHTNVTKSCDKSVTREEERREEKKEEIEEGESDKSDPPANKTSVGEMVLAEWNRLMGQSCQWTDKRRTAFRQRWKKQFWRDSWKQAVERAAASRFCRGENDRGWLADFEWFLKPDTVTKLLEGKYDHREGRQIGKTFAQQTQSNVQQLLVKAAADDAAAGRASGLAGFLGGSDGN